MKFLSDEEVDILLLSLARARGDRGFTEDEGKQVVEWAEDVMMRHTLLEMALDKEVLINVKDGGEIVFSMKGG